MPVFLMVPLHPSSRPAWSRMIGGLATGAEFGIAGRPLPEPQVRVLDFRSWPPADGFASTARFNPDLP
jgi:hypothetical protein